MSNPGQDINFQKSFLSKDCQQQELPADDMALVWQDIQDISEISFELLLPKDKITKKEEVIPNDIARDILSAEETLMRQNLVNLAIKENIVIKENKDNSVNIVVKSEDGPFIRDFKFNLPRMSEDDLRFFELLAAHKNIKLKNRNCLVFENGYKKEVLSELKFSKSFLNLLDYSIQTQRPIRIDFNRDSSVILRIDRFGKVSAEFISSDKIMEHLLRTNIPNLKKKLDKSGIRYKRIYYKDEDE